MTCMVHSDIEIVFVDGGNETNVTAVCYDCNTQLTGVIDFGQQDAHVEVDDV